MANFDDICLEIDNMFDIRIISYFQLLRSNLKLVMSQNYHYTKYYYTKLKFMISHLKLGVF